MIPFLKNKLLYEEDLPISNHSSAKPMSVLADLSACLIANKMAADMQSGGSPTPEHNTISKTITPGTWITQ